jgi:hypothetical protein
MDIRQANPRSCRLEGGYARWGLRVAAEDCSARALSSRAGELRAVGGGTLVRTTWVSSAVQGPLRLALTGGSTSLIILASAGCHVDFVSCEGHASRDYPALERVASQALSGVKHPAPLRLSSCEGANTGSPHARVAIDVLTWVRRDQAISYLTGENWQIMPGRDHMLSPNKKYVARLVMTKDPEHHHLYTQVSFGPASES